MLKSEQHKLDRVNFERFKAGDEKAFSHFYNHYYKHYAFRANRFVKDDVISNSIAQEAFLRLWMMRNRIKDSYDIQEFLMKQVKDAVRLFYTQNNVRFHRAMLRIDGIENFHDYIHTEERSPGEEDNVMLNYLEEEKKVQIKKIKTLIPNISQEHQLFIRLCLKFSFNYERIAYYLGGISDYEVSLIVEKCLQKLKVLLLNASRMNTLSVKRPLLVEGELSDEQMAIFKMRYDFNYSFDQIALKLNLNSKDVKNAFIEAHLSLKNSR